MTVMSRWRAKLRVGLQWGIPGAGIALIPKCPLCATICGVVATWYGISLDLANTVRIALLAVSTFALLWLLIRLAKDRVLRRTRRAGVPCRRECE